MKAIKPLSLGVLYKPYRFNGAERLVIAALGFFRLGAPAERFLTENLQWTEVLKRLPADQPLDMVMPKPHAEVLAAATAYAPGGKAVSEMEVRLRVGAVDKRLRVVGEREWAYGAVPLHRVGAPRPFTAMSIDYTRAYGGAAHPGNPVGRGHTGNRLGLLHGPSGGPMPNVEYPDRPVTGHGTPLPPAGFGPLDVRWEPRSLKSGTYDAKWLREQAPGLPLDIDWSQFNAAPEDQWLTAGLAGGEPYRLEGLHPQRPVIEGELPALRVRAFVQRAGGSPHAAEEVGLRPDTVWFFPDAELGVLVYRGEAHLARSDAADVESLLLAYEASADAPRPAEHYRTALALRLDPASAAAHAFNDAPLLPEPDAARRAARAAAQQAAEAQTLARIQAQIDASVAELRARNGGELPEGFTPPKAKLPSLGVIPREVLASGEADLTELLARGDALVAEAQADGEARLEELKARQAELPQPPAADATAEAAADKITDQTKEALRRARGEHHAERAAALAGAMESDPELAAKAAKLADDTPALERTGRHAALKPVPEALPEAVARALGGEARRLLAAGEGLAGRDLAGADLRGLDLNGVDLHGALLERADLRGAHLAGANLAGAVLAGARLEGADLSGANLEGASLNGVRGERALLAGVRAARASAIGAELAGAVLTGADLSGWIAHQANLDGADLEGATLEGALLLKVSARGSRWRSARLEKCVLYAALLEGADFSAAQLVRTVFAEVKGAKASFRAARLERVFAGSADFSGADLGEAQARMCSWRKGDLRGARLDGGLFTQCDFGNANLDGASLRAARLCSSILSGASLRGCDGWRLDLFQAQCRMSDFEAADLRESRLRQADFSEANFHHARLDGARYRPAGIAA